MSSVPLTVCIPTYNSARYITEAIESVLSQTCRNFELLIIDDQSTDESAKIISLFAEQDKRIVWKINERNLGMAGNWNRCLNEARGRYVKFLFADDLLATDSALEKMVSLLDSDHKISLVTTARTLIDAESATISTAAKYSRDLHCSGTDIIRDCLMEQSNKIGEPSAVMFRKEHALRGFNPRYRQFVDLEMWFHILQSGNMAYIDEPLCKFRVHPGQQTAANLRDLVHLDERFMLLADYADKPYIRIPWMMKTYMFYVPAYTLWKHYRGDSRGLAWKKLRERYSIPKFILCFPLYRICKLYIRFRKHVVCRITGKAL